MFIDRDGERFRVILNWLQTGQIKLTDIAEAECILSDATFFNVWSFFILLLLTCAASRAD